MGQHIKNLHNKKTAPSKPNLGTDTVEFLQGLLHSAPVTIYHVNLPEINVGSYVSPNIQENLGITFNLPASTSDWFEYIHPDDKNRVSSEFQAWIKTIDATVLRQEYRIRDTQGIYRWIADIAKKKISNNEVVGVTGCLSNLSDTRIEHEQLEKIAAVSPGVIYQLKQNANGHYSFPYVSAKINQVLDLQPEDVHSSSAPVFNKLHPEDRELMLTTLAASRATMSSYEYDYRVIKEGRVFWVRDNAVPEKTADGGIIWSGVAIDITEQKKVEEELRQLSFTDTLTKLANRRHFLMETERLITSSNRHGRNFSLLMYDLDHFKQVNDSYGHDIGDEVLIQVSEVVRGRVRACDLVARIGGEEFVVLLPDTDLNAAQRVAEELRNSISEIEFKAAAKVFHVTVTFGVTCYNATDNSPEDILKRADKLLYQGKEGGRNQVVAAA